MLGRATSAISVPGIASCRPAFVYDEGVRTLLLALKYRNRRDALAYLASQIAQIVDVEADVVTWVPTTGARRRARGFDQAELLARAVGRRTGLPVRSLLCRVSTRRWWHHHNRGSSRSRCARSPPGWCQGRSLAATLR